MRWVDRDVLSGRAARSAAGRVHPRHGPRSQAITVTYATRSTAGTAALPRAPGRRMSTAACRRGSVESACRFEDKCLLELA